MVNRCSLCGKECPDAALILIKEEDEIRYYCRGTCLDQKIKWDVYEESE